MMYVYVYVYVWLYVYIYIYIYIQYESFRTVGQDGSKIIGVLDDDDDVYLE
jgi:hypothetical protein